MAEAGESGGSEQDDIAFLRTVSKVYVNQALYDSQVFHLQQTTINMYFLFPYESYSTKPPLILSVLPALQMDST